MKVCILDANTLSFVGGLEGLGRVCSNEVSHAPEFFQSYNERGWILERMCDLVQSGDQYLFESNVVVECNIGCTEWSLTAQENSGLVELALNTLDLRFQPLSGIESVTLNRESGGSNRTVPRSRWKRL